MDDASTMDVIEPAAGIEADHEGLRWREQPTAIENVAKASAGQILEHQVGPLVAVEVVDTKVVDRIDIGVNQRSSSLSLGQKTLLG